MSLSEPTQVTDQHSLLTEPVSDTSSVSPELPSSHEEPDLKSVIKIQKNIRAHMIKIQLKAQFKKMHQRRRIIKELLETEERYIRDLGFIVSDFNMRMRSRGILTGEECDKLFANVDEIRKLHDIFFSTLYEHFAHYHPYLMIFADVLAHISYFRIYIEYLNNFPFACDLVEEYKKTKPSFAKFVSEINRNTLYKGLGLEDYMIMPIQRLPRYCLLLKELIKNTLPTHPDYENVKKALHLFEDVNSSNNQKLDKIRNSYRLRELEQQLKLPEDIITPSSEFIMEESVQIINKENNQVLPNCVIYLLSNVVIITRRCGALVLRDTRMPTSHSARISQVSGYGSSTFKEKLETMVPLKYATSVELNKDQCFFKNSFTIQTEGESCTFICSNQEELHTLFTKVKKQRDIVKEITITKLKSIFQTDVQQNCEFIKNISMLDILPDVSVLGTTERTDKMLKYTVYIVEVKVKMIRQKIFLRFSELLELEKFINNEYGNKVAIKQGLVSSGWLNNHHQKTIEERKMNIQRFLKEILSKPEVIKNGWKILLRLGLPGDFFELPNTVKDKNVESFVRKSTAFGKSTIIGNQKKKNKAAPKYRLSLFQQQRIEEEEDENSDGDDEIVQDIIKESFQEAPKSSFGSSQQSQSLCIQAILKANEIDLGHYTRGESVDYEENNPYSRMENFNSMVELEVHVPNIQFFYSLRNVKIESSGGKTFEKIGYKKVIVKCSKMQRIQNIVPIIAKEINLKYYKDFRLVVEKEYSQRVLDDDELVHKVLGEINRTHSCILFKKIIFIDHAIEERELTSDRERLMIEASQIINEIKMGKYRLNYESYLKFAVLSSIVYVENQPFRKELSQVTLSSLARESKNIIFPKYSSLSQTEDVWVSDFLRVFQIIRNKLKEIVELNDEHIDKNKSNISGAKEIEDHESSFNLTNSSYWVNTNVLYLAMLSIVKEMEKNEVLYGCVSFSVQISEDFKNFLEREINIEIENILKEKSLANVETVEKESKVFSQITNRNVSLDNLESFRLSKKISEEENKNCWLAIKHNKILFTSISKNCILLELSYENLIKIETYASAVVLLVRGMHIKRIKLKTTSSYYIREMLVYYKNYRSVLKKIYTDNEVRNSVLEMSREEYGDPPQEMDEYYL